MMYLIYFDIIGRSDQTSQSKGCKHYFRLQSIQNALVNTSDMVAFNASVQEIWDELNTHKANYENAKYEYKRSVRDEFILSTAFGAVYEILTRILPLAILVFYNYKIIRLVTHLIWYILLIDVENHAGRW